MTREAKIGMLTGLGVIILIGVLLSEYLGDGKGLASASAAGFTMGAATPADRMAELPVGAQYRKQVMQPVTVPGNEMAELPIAYAAEAPSGSQQIAENGPMVAQPVAAVAIGPVPQEQRVTGAPPIIQVSDVGHDVTMETKAAAPAEKQPVTSKTYEIAAGDTLAKIARKFYNSGKNSDVQRIVAANPGTLKNADTPLVTGKKLNIPDAPVVAAKTTTPTVETVKKPVVVYVPGSGDAKVSKGEKPADVKKGPATKTYKVQAHDTLASIARKLAPSRSSEMVAKLKAVNGIKDPTAIKAGQELKVPA